MTRRRHRRTALAAGAISVALALGLSACSPVEDTSAAMHSSVVQVAERAAAGDYAGALAELALLDRDVASAADAGRIDAEREQEIRAAMDLVRADLEAAEVRTTPTPTPTPTEEGDDDKGNDDKGKDGKGNGNEGNSGNDDD